MWYFAQFKLRLSQLSAPILRPLYSQWACFIHLWHQNSHLGSKHYSHGSKHCCLKHRIHRYWRQRYRKGRVHQTFLFSRLRGYFWSQAHQLHQLWKSSKESYAIKYFRRAHLLGCLIWKVLVYSQLSRGIRYKECPTTWHRCPQECPSQSLWKWRFRCHWTRYTPSHFAHLWLAILWYYLKTRECHQAIKPHSIN